MFKVNLSIKQKFLINLGIYTLGFIILYSIGTKLNNNSYHPSGFFAPLFILIGMSGMVLSLTNGKNVKPKK